MNPIHQEPKTRIIELYSMEHYEPLKEEEVEGGETAGVISETQHEERATPKPTRDFLGTIGDRMEHRDDPILEFSLLLD